MEHLEYLKKNRELFFKFMKNTYPVHVNSNIFLRDIQYSIKSFLANRNFHLKYTILENLAVCFTEFLEKEEQLLKLNKNTWKVNFSDKSDVINNKIDIPSDNKMEN